MFSFNLLPWALVALTPALVAAIGDPFGQAAGTTGGGSATPATPSSNAELEEWLSDSTARVIVLDSIFDFTGTEGTTTGTACAPWTCSPDPQLAIDSNSWCENYQPDATTSTVTYDSAGPSPLVVGSNKTLLGSGSNGGIKGKGLKITDGSNIIIQNIKITDINAQYVWGGDALQIDGGSNIWIDHNYFQHIGRQMVVTGYGAVTKTTFSNNVFNGEGTYSATCNGRHYWVGLFLGGGDQITFALNYLYKTSGRGPHVGGTDGYYQDVHIYNNYFVDIEGHAIDAGVGAKVLAEGNYFNTVTTPLLEDDGEAYVPSSDEVSACSATIGRTCVANTFTSSGTPSTNVANALAGFTDSVSEGATILTAQEAADYVQANAGVGIVN
ncbi:polysaccharide lyase family 1 protein [Cylindrobasidium torrendii FP15055 ss-10]|uniref:pectin lyase n=1 Tax=Cylindrobasidium torrendii FP15055 ss-10 TaxID=1314674 RepID=A0A0D7B0S9_9AGAR|nr:polysaccharide lyase family 1 protein [Cylindrobasidium torrendii FP15055 ss-10]